jgi:hypothetical protein
MKNFLILFLTILVGLTNCFSQVKPVDQQYQDSPVFNKNPGYEQGKSNYSLYADAAGVLPVNMTGGSAHITAAINGTNPIDGIKDLIITKDAADRQGEGISFPFTIPAGMQGNVLQACFRVRTSAAYADSDAIFYLYDVTNAALIAPVTQNIMAYAASTGATEQCFQFQAPINSTSLRGGIHISTVNAAAYTLTIDNFKVQKPRVVNGAVVTAFKSCTVTGTWTTNTTYTCQEKRVGDTATYRIKVALSGAPTSAQLKINLPAGEVIDTAKLTNLAAEQETLGSNCIIYAGYSHCKVMYSTANDVYLTVDKTDGTYNTIDTVTQAVPRTFANGDLIDMEFSVPIVGWNATAVLGQDASTQVIEAIYEDRSGSTWNVNSIVQFDTKIKDDMGIVTTGAGWKVTAPVTGIYHVKLSSGFAGNLTAGQKTQARIYKSAVGDAVLATNLAQASINAYFPMYGEVDIPLNQGEYIDIRNTGTANTSQDNSAGYSRLQITRAPGPASFVVPEKVIEIFTSNNGSQSCADGQTIEFEDVEKSTHGAYNTTTGEFTAPWSGLVKTTAVVTGNSTAQTATNVFNLLLKKNGSNISSGTNYVIQANHTYVVKSVASTEVYLLKGEVLKYTINSSAASTTLNGDSYANRVTFSME